MYMVLLILHDTLRSIYFKRGSYSALVRHAGNSVWWPYFCNYSGTSE